MEAPASWATATCRPREWQPKKVEALSGQRVVAASVGAYHSIALTADGDAFAWGQGDGGRLGHGEDESNQLLPKKVEAWAPGLGRAGPRRRAERAAAHEGRGLG